MADGPVIALVDGEHHPAAVRELLDELEHGRGLTGVVTFHKIGDNTTRVMVQMDWAPEGIKEKIGAALGADDRRVQGDLERFKEFVEARGSETGAYREEVPREA